KSTRTMQLYLKNKHQIDLNELKNKSTKKKKFIQEEFINIITDWIVDNDQSFRVIEKPSFKKIIEYLNDDAKLILAITTDNIANNNTIFQYFANRCAYDGINFDIDNQR
ncbi:6156_t:CDS:2, partial [Racocetra persica]